MPLHAAKCTLCKSYQDIRRHIFSWSSVIAALIAIVPFFSIASSLTKIAKQPGAKISIKDIQCEPDRINLFAVNSGGRPAAIYDPEVSTYDGAEIVKLDHRFEIATEKSRVDSGDFQQLELKLKTGQQFPRKSGRNQCEILIKLRTLDADHDNPTTLEGKCPCAN